MLTFMLMYAHTHIKTQSWKNIETDDSLKCFGINSSSPIIQSQLSKSYN